MSLRAFGTRLFKHGTTILRLLCKREIHNTTTIIGEQTKAVKEVYVTNSTFRNVGLQARRIFVNGLLNRVTNSLAADLRRKAARRMLFGDSRPFLAFVGVSLASGTGILTKDEELEGVCLEIREAVSKINWNHVDEKQMTFEETAKKAQNLSLNDFKFGTPIAKGCSAVVYNTKLAPSADDYYPFAMKMMFNYDIQSNAIAILRAMHRETVPSQNPVPFALPQQCDWESNIAERFIRVPPHPNIVAMYSVFVDRVPELPNATDLYPAALPRRIHPEGEGRNMSLFMLMKRYDCSLKQYLIENKPTIQTSILLLAQLLEGVIHLYKLGVAHRDLKTDNLLLDVREEFTTPILVISDFGCCLADKYNGLHLPYNTFEIEKGGNVALMAPEIVVQKPGTFSVLNYTKSDLWAVGAIAYEIFGQANPFYGSRSGGNETLQNTSYCDDDLPVLNDQVPNVIKALIRNMLARNPKKRLQLEVAANVCHLYLWAPSDWLKKDLTVPSSTEILQWLLCLTMKVLCEGRLKPETPTFHGFGRRTYPEYLLISNFLCRVKLVYIKEALHWIHNNV